MDVDLIVLLAGAVSGLLGSFALAHLALRAAFRLRPSTPDTLQSFFHASTIGALIMVPPMVFAGFVVFSMAIKGASIRTLNVAVEHPLLLGGLLVSGLLVQVLLGQRLSLVSGIGTDTGDRLVVDLVLFGSFRTIAKNDIASIELHAPVLASRHKRIRIDLNDGTTTRLAFGEEILGDLRSWADWRPCALPSAG